MCLDGAGKYMSNSCVWKSDQNEGRAQLTRFFNRALHVFVHFDLLYVYMCTVQFAMVEVAVTFIMDGFGKKILPIFKRKELIILAVCSFGFLLGIPHITRVNIIQFHFINKYCVLTVEILLYLDQVDFLDLELFTLDTWNIILV